MADDEPHRSSCSGASASTSGGSSSSRSRSRLSPSPAPAPSLPLAAVVTPLPPPFPSAACIATAIPLPQQQLLHQQYQLQQQQRLFSFHLAPGTVASPSTPTPPSLPLKHSLPFSSASLSPVPAFAPAPCDRNSRDDCWSEGATFALIQAWGDRYLELNRGNLKQKHWRDVADAVNRRADGSKTPKTDIQCKNRIDTLKKKYKLEKIKIVAGGPRKWTFFDRLDELIGASKKPKKPLAVKPRAAVPLLPLPAGIALPARRPLGDADQGLQFQLPGVPASNYCPSSAANHAALNRIGRPPNHGITGSNYVGSAPDHTVIAPCHNENNLNHAPNAHNQFASNANHVASAVDATSKSKDSPHTADSCPNGESAQPKRRKHKRPCSDPMQELTQAIIKFGEVYERTEIARQQTITEIEKQRMIFAKDLELQRLQFFTQTQVELGQLRLKVKRGQTDHNC